MGVNSDFVFTNGSQTLNNKTLNYVGASGDFINAQVTSDTSYRFSLNNSGTLDWGPGNAAQDTFLSRSGAGELGLSGTSNASLTVTSDSNGLIIAGKTDPNYQLLLGLSSNFGSIQSIEQGYGYTPLVLNLSGGYVSINTALSPSYPLDVDGAIHSSLGYHMPTSGALELYSIIMMKI